MKNELVKDEIEQALFSNQYVQSVRIGEVSFSNTSLTADTNKTSLTGRSDKENFNLAVIDFTAQCDLSSNSSSVDVKSLITESFGNFLNTTVHLKMEGIIYISEAHKKKIQDHLTKNEGFLSAPDADEFNRIITDDNKSYCKNSHQWTPWFSTYDVTDGSDFEILANHVKKHRFLNVLKQLTSILLDEIF